MHDFFYKRYICSIYCIYVCKSKRHKFSLFNVLLQKNIFIAEYCDRFGLYGNTAEVEVTKIILTKVYI